MSVSDADRIAEIDAWGLFRLPAEPAPGELKWVRNAHALPRSWRGFVAEYATSQEAHDAWIEGLFVRAIVDSRPPYRSWESRR